MTRWERANWLTCMGFMQQYYMGNAEEYELNWRLWEWKKCLVQEATEYEAISMRELCDWSHCWPVQWVAFFPFLPAGSGMHHIGRHKEMPIAVLWAVWKVPDRQLGGLLFPSVPFPPTACPRMPSLGCPSNREVDSWRNDRWMTSAQG